MILCSPSIGPRPRVDERHLLRLASHLTDRDRRLSRLLYEHRVLTSLQVCDIAFSCWGATWMTRTSPTPASPQTRVPGTRSSIRSITATISFMSGCERNEDTGWAVGAQHLGPTRDHLASHYGRFGALAWSGHPRADGGLDGPFLKRGLLWVAMSIGGRGQPLHHRDQRRVPSAASPVACTSAVLHLAVPTVHGPA